MSKCDNCRLRKESARAFDIHWMGEDDCPYDKCPVPDLPKTNADRLRAMSDEELAVILAKITEPNKLPMFHGLFMNGEKDVWLDWLRQEAQDG